MGLFCLCVQVTCAPMGSLGVQLPHKASCYLDLLFILVCICIVCVQVTCATMGSLGVQLPHKARLFS
jgi:hypothetical protein